MGITDSPSLIPNSWIWNLYYVGRHAILPIIFVVYSFCYSLSIILSLLSLSRTTVVQPQSATNRIVGNLHQTLDNNLAYYYIEYIAILLISLIITNKIIWQGIPVSLGIIISSIYSYFYTSSIISTSETENLSSLPNLYNISINNQSLPILNTSIISDNYNNNFGIIQNIFLQYQFNFLYTILESLSLLFNSDHINTISSVKYILLPLITGSITTILCLIIFPPIRLPPLTGKYQTVGTISDVWERPLQSIFFHQLNGTVKLLNTRKIPIQIYYPSNSQKPQFDKRALLWTTGGSNSKAQLQKIIYEFTNKLMGCPSLFSSIPLSHFLHTRARYCYNVPLNNDQEKWPVIIYSHGLFGWKAYNSYICSELASHGYIVIGIDHIGDSICSYECAGTGNTTTMSNIPDTESLKTDSSIRSTLSDSIDSASSSSTSITPSLFTLFTDGPTFISQSLDTQRKIYTLNAHIRHTDILHVARRIIALSNEQLFTIDDEDTGSLKSSLSNHSHPSSSLSNPHSNVSSSNISPSSSMGNIAEHILENGIDISAPITNNPILHEPITTAAVSSTPILNLFQGRLSTLQGLGILGHSYGGATSILAVSTHGIYPSLPKNNDDIYTFSTEDKEEDEYMHSIHVLREPYYTEGNINIPDTQDRRKYCWYAPKNLREPKFAVGVTLDAFLWGISDGPTLGYKGNPFQGIHSYKNKQACMNAINEFYNHSLQNEQFQQRIQSIATKYKGSPLLLLNSDKNVWEYELLQIPFIKGIIERMNLHESNYYKQSSTLPTSSTSNSSITSTSSSSILIPGCGHLNFTDLALVCHPYFLRRAGRIGSGHPIAVLVNIANHTVNYFQHHLPVEKLKQ